MNYNEHYQIGSLNQQKLKNTGPLEMLEINSNLSNVIKPKTVKTRREWNQDLYVIERRERQPREPLITYIKIPFPVHKNKLQNNNESGLLGQNNLDLLKHQYRIYIKNKLMIDQINQQRLMKKEKQKIKDEKIEIDYQQEIFQEEENIKLKKKKQIIQGEENTEDEQLIPIRVKEFIIDKSLSDMKLFLDIVDLFEKKFIPTEIVAKKNKEQQEKDFLKSETHKIFVSNIQLDLELIEKPRRDLINLQELLLMRVIDIVSERGLKTLSYFDYLTFKDIVEDRQKSLLAIKQGLLLERILRFKLKLTQMSEEEQNQIEQTQLLNWVKNEFSYLQCMLEKQGSISRHKYKIKNNFKELQTKETVINYQELLFELQNWQQNSDDFEENSKLNLEEVVQSALEVKKDVQLYNLLINKKLDYQNDVAMLIFYILKEAELKQNNKSNRSSNEANNSSASNEKNEPKFFNNDNQKKRKKVINELEYLQQILIQNQLANDNFLEKIQKEETTQNYSDEMIGSIIENIERNNYEESLKKNYYEFFRVLRISKKIFYKKIQLSPKEPYNEQLSQIKPTEIYQIQNLISKSQHIFKKSINKFADTNLSQDHNNSNNFIQISPCKPTNDNQTENLMNPPKGQKSIQIKRKEKLPDFKTIEEDNEIYQLKSYNKRQKNKIRDQSSGSSFSENDEYNRKQMRSKVMSAYLLKKSKQTYDESFCAINESEEQNGPLKSIIHEEDETQIVRTLKAKKFIKQKNQLPKIQNNRNELQKIAKVQKDDYLQWSQDKKILLDQEKEQKRLIMEDKKAKLQKMNELLREAKKRQVDLQNQSRKKLVPVYQIEQQVQQQVLFRRKTYTEKQIQNNNLNLKIKKPILIKEVNKETIGNLKSSVFLLIQQLKEQNGNDDDDLSYYQNLYKEENNKIQELDKISQIKNKNKNENEQFLFKQDYQNSLNDIFKAQIKFKAIDKRSSMFISNIANIKTSDYDIRQQTSSTYEQYLNRKKDFVDTSEILKLKIKQNQTFDTIYQTSVDYQLEKVQQDQVKLQTIYEQQKIGKPILEQEEYEDEKNKSYLRQLKKYLKGMGPQKWQYILKQQKQIQRIEDSDYSFLKYHMPQLFNEIISKDLLN